MTRGLIRNINLISYEPLILRDNKTIPRPTNITQLIRVMFVRIF